MRIYDRVKDRALAEIYTLIYIAFLDYKNGAIPRYEYELLKRNYLYDKSVYREYCNDFASNGNFVPLSDPLKGAEDVLCELFEAGAITPHEYESEKTFLKTDG